MNCCFSKLYFESLTRCCCNVHWQSGTQKHDNKSQSGIESSVYLSVQAIVKTGRSGIQATNPTRGRLGGLGPKTAGRSSTGRSGRNRIWYVGVLGKTHKTISQRTEGKGPVHILRG